MPLNHGDADFRVSGQNASMPAAEESGWWATLLNFRTTGGLCASAAMRRMSRLRSLFFPSSGLSARPPSARCRCDRRAPCVAVLALLMLSGCTSVSDFGRLSDQLVTDDIHAWVGEEAAASTGGLVSADNLTGDEQSLRDLAFPLIEPAYDRIRWDAVVYEYGTK